MWCRMATALVPGDDGTVIRGGERGGQWGNTKAHKRGREAKGSGGRQKGPARVAARWECGVAGRH